MTLKVVNNQLPLENYAAEDDMPAEFVVELSERSLCRSRFNAVLQQERIYRQQ